MPQWAWLLGQAKGGVNQIALSYFVWIVLNFFPNLPNILCYIIQQSSNGSTFHSIIFPRSLYLWLYCAICSSWSLIYSLGEGPRSNYDPPSLYLPIQLFTLYYLHVKHYFIHAFLISLYYYKVVFCFINIHHVNCLCKSSSKLSILKGMIESLYHFNRWCSYSLQVNVSHAIFRVLVSPQYMLKLNFQL